MVENSPALSLDIEPILLSLDGDNLYFKDETFWINQNVMAELNDVTIIYIGVELLLRYTIWRWI